MYKRSLKQALPLRLSGCARQRLLFHRIGFKIEQEVSTGIKIQRHLVSRFADSEQPRPAALIEEKRIGATSDTLGNRRPAPRRSFLNLFPVTPSLKFNRDSQPGRCKQRWRKMQQAEGIARDLSFYHSRYAEQEWNVNQLFRQPGRMVAAIVF